MDRLLTIKEVHKFFKQNIKIILLTMLAVMSIYGIGLAYTQITNNQVKEMSDAVPTSGAKTAAILQENKNTVFMKFFIENTEDGVFTNFRLLNEIMTDKEFVKNLSSYPQIEKLLDEDYEIIDIINLKFDNSNNTHILTVSTGVLTANLSILNEIKTAMTDGTFRILNNKEVYFISEPQKIADDTNQNLSTITNDSLSIKDIALYTIIVLGGAVVLGVLVAIIKSGRMETIGELQKVELGMNEILLDLSIIEEEKLQEEQLIHSVKHPAVKEKLVLVEKGILPSISQKLKKESQSILVSDSILNVDASKTFDEIVLIVSRNNTSKDWFKQQRIQLANYSSQKKIILM